MDHFTSLTHSLTSLHFTSLFTTRGVGGRQWGAKEAGRTRMVPSGFSDTAFPSRVRPRALRALRRARLSHLRKMTQKLQKKLSKRAPSPAKTEVLHEKKSFFLLKKTTQPRKKQNFCIKKWQKNDKNLTKKSRYTGMNPEVLDEKFKIVLPIRILKKNSRPPTSPNF